MYDGNSPIVSIGKATAAQIDELFAAVAAERDQGVTDPPAGLGQTFITWCAAYRGVTVNHDLAAAQSAHETAGWTSFWASKNNPAGIGVDGTPGKGIVFDSVGAGIEAQVCHLLDYAVGVGQWTAHDPRAGDMPKSSFGSAPTIAGLNGKWATPGVGYGQSIAKLANRLLTMEGSMAAEVPGFEWVPEKTEFGYPKGTRGRNGRTIDRFIQHCTIGTDSLGSLLGENGNSVHLLDHRDGTPRAQMVALADAAWGCGNREYNLRAVNYEHECTGAEMLNPAYWTDSIINNMARIAADVIRLCPGILPDREHVIGHGDVPDQDHTDPGPVFPWDRYIAAIQRELGGAMPDPSVRYFPETNHSVGHGFLDYWQRFGDDITSIEVFGYPLTEEITEDGQTCQYFERAVFEYHPENPPEHSILLRRLGADALDNAA